MKRNNSFFRAGVTVFLTVGAILLFYDTLFGSRVLMALLRQLLRAIQPILIGGIIAYLLAPIVDFFDRTLFRAATNKARGAGRFCAPGARAASLVITWAVIGALSYLLLSVLVPDVYRSVLQLLGNLESYYNTINRWIMELLDKSPEVEVWVMNQMAAYYEDLSKLLTEQILPQAQQLMGVVSGGVVSLISLLKNLLVGAIVSIYLLATKERCAAQAKKVVHGLFSRENVRWVLRGARKADDICSGFLRGKLLDSLIIGIICFVCSTLFAFPYAPLVSVIVGITNIIPFFGPFLGAIPCFFLILLVSPVKSLYFLVFILALQQVDGNIIGPKILGDRTGLPGLWVITAVLVGGSFFGVPGMFFAVPVFACIYTAATFWIGTRLRRKDLPETTAAYTVPQTPEKTPPPEK